MKAWVIDKTYNLNFESNPLQLADLPKPVPKAGEILIRVSHCGICHTEIDEIEGRTLPASFPVIPGHQVVGIVEISDPHQSDIKIGDRVGVAWIFSACGKCEYCHSNRENLCKEFKATGRDAHGGYAEFIVAPSRFVYKIPPVFQDHEAAPLLCAGAVGYRSLSLCNTENGEIIGLLGFGASAHLVLKLIKYMYPASLVYVFARSTEERSFAVELGCSWTGDITDQPPQPVDCIIDTTPVWKPLLSALEYLKPGGRLVINAIRKEEADKEHLIKLDYTKHLWMEKEIKTVANVTSNDVIKFLEIAAKIPLLPEVELYKFEYANKAIMDIKNHKIKGAKVLRINN